MSSSSFAMSSPRVPSPGATRCVWASTSPGRDGGGAVIPPLRGGAVGNLDVALAADRGDAVTVDQERGLVDGRGRAAVEQTVGRDQGEARRCRRYPGLIARS